MHSFPYPLGWTEVVLAGGGIFAICMAIVFGMRWWELHRK